MTFRYKLNFLVEKKVDVETFTSTQPVNRLDLIEIDNENFVVMAVQHTESATILHVSNGIQSAEEAVMICADPRRLALEVEQFDAES